MLKCEVSGINKLSSKRAVVFRNEKNANFFHTFPFLYLIENMKNHSSMRKYAPCFGDQ